MSLLKKVLSVLVLTALIFSGCSQTDEEQMREELKAEIKAELAAEQAAAEAEAQAQIEETNKEDVQEEVTLDIRNEAALVEFIINQFDLEVEKESLQSNLEFVYVDFNRDGKDEVIVYTPVKNGFYDVAVVQLANGAFSLVESELESSGMSDHKVQIKDDFILYSSKATGTGVSVSYTEIYTFHNNKVTFTQVALQHEGYEAQPPMEQFPEGYQTELIGKITFLEGENNYRHFSFDTRQTGNYEWHTVKEYTFNAGTGNYDIVMILDTLNNQAEETATSNEEASDVYDPANIQVGQEFGGLKVREVDYSKNDSLILECEGAVEVEGTLTSYIDGMTDERVFVFEARTPLFDKPLVYQFDDWKNETRGFVGSLLNAKDFIDEGTQNYLADGNSLGASVTIDRYHHAYANGTEGGEWMTAKALQIQVDENFIGYVESRQGDKPRDMITESFPTEKGEVIVDYGQYLCVVLPMWPTANEGKLETQTVHFNGAYINTLSFSVFGEIQNLQVQNIMGMDQASEWVDLGTLKNTKVFVEASLPTDVSYVKVKGLVHLGEGTYEEVEFTLDDMRSLEGYDIIMVQ